MDPTLDAPDVRQVFDTVLHDEPDMVIDASGAARLGRRLRRRRQARHAVAGLSVCGLLAAALLATADRERSPTTETASPDWLFTSSEGVPAATSSERVESDLARQIVAAIQAGSPGGWTIDLRESSMPGVTEGWLDGTADDGAGPGRLFVYVTRQPGVQTLHPCGDRDFVQGGSCEETVLPGGSVLSVRGLVDFDGVRYVDVTLTHPDGTGVGAESGNFVVPEVAPGAELSVDSPGGMVVRPQLTIGRPDPTYTADQLADLVLTVDEAIP